MNKSILLACALIAPGIAWSKNIYVDQTISSSCNSYSVSDRVCTLGGETAYTAVSSAVRSAEPGDQVLLRSGRYSTLQISTSGSEGSYIHVKAHDGETVSVSGSGIGFNISDSAYVQISGITIQNILGFGRVEDSHHITIDGIHFESASSSGTTGGLKFVRSTHSVISNNSFADGSDLVILQDDSNNNLLIGNEFSQATHSLLSIRCSSENVVRGNRFGNAIQKSVELYDCEGVSDAPVRLDDAKRNLIEGNDFYLTAPTSKYYYYNAIQHAGQLGITRFNKFHGNEGGGVQLQYYSDEALYNYRNRVYSNTFFNNRCFGFGSYRFVSGRYYGHEIVNNAFYQNSDCSGGGSQVNIPDASAITYRGNYESDQDPKFVAASEGNFSLQQGSPLIDRGEFLTRAVGSGTGTKITVVDASFFYDGNSIAGEIGDVVKIESNGQYARIIAVDLSTNELTLDSAVSWVAGDGVSLFYEGAAPDVGAFEYGMKAPPNSPDNVRASQLL